MTSLVDHSVVPGLSLSWPIGPFAGGVLPGWCSPLGLPFGRRGGPRRDTSFAWRRLLGACWFRSPRAGGMSARRGACLGRKSQARL